MESVLEIYKRFYHPDFPEEVNSWCNERNKKETWIDWRFTTEDARIKLKRLYPSLNN
jgi:hypothetical protein